MALPFGSVSQLLLQVQDNTKKYLEYFTSQGLPEPSFDVGDGLDPRQPPPDDIIAIRDAAIDAADELHQLLLGPLGVFLGCHEDVGDQDLYLIKANIFSNTYCLACSIYIGTE